MPKSLPPKPSLRHLRKQAKNLLRELQSGDSESFERLRESHPDFRDFQDEQLAATVFALHHAQFVVAREYGFSSWTQLKRHVESTAPDHNGTIKSAAAWFLDLTEKLPDSPLISELIRSLYLKLLRGHEAGDWVTAEFIRNCSPSMVGKNRQEILRSPLPETDARETAARYFSFSSWNTAMADEALKLDPDFENAVNAVITGNVETLRSLLVRRPALATERSRFGHHAALLHYVAANGVEIHRQFVPANAVEITRALLESGAEVDALADTYGGGPEQTTLILLITSGHPSELGLKEALIDALLDHGAAVNGVAGSKKSPLESAVQFGYIEAVRALTRRGAVASDLFTAAGAGLAAQVEVFLKSQPDRKQLDGAVYIAGRNGHLPVVKQSVEAGGNVNAKGFFGGTGLHWAAMNGYDAVVKFLVTRGADVNLRDDQFEATTAGWANEGNQTAIRDWLLLNGCGASICEAAAFGRMDLVEERLREDPASANLVEGRSALHEAAGRGNEDLVILLLQYGAHRDATDANGLRPIDWARYKGQEKLVKLLEGA